MVRMRSLNREAVTTVVLFLDKVHKIMINNVLMWPREALQHSRANVSSTVAAGSR
jgi:hypothetical protein